MELVEIKPMTFDGNYNPSTSQSSIDHVLCVSRRSSATSRYRSLVIEDAGIVAEQPAGLNILNTYTIWALLKSSPRRSRPPLC